MTCAQRLHGRPVAGIRLVIDLDGAGDGEIGELFGEHRAEAHLALFMAAVGARADHHGQMPGSAAEKAAHQQCRRAPSHPVVYADIGRAGCGRRKLDRVTEVRLPT